MQISPEELFAQIGHLTIENKVLYNTISQLEARIIELEKEEGEDQVEKDAKDTSRSPENVDSLSHNS